MANSKEDDQWDLERGPMPVIAAPPSNIHAKPRSAAVAAAGDEEDEEDRKIPNCVRAHMDRWV
jgi:hypothetical protein